MLNFFGTDGIRGHVGSGLFVQEKLIGLGKAISQWAHTKYSGTPHLLIAHDTRISSSFIKAALKTGLLQNSLVVHDTFILPTPALAHITQLRSDIHCSVMISASHNPYADNGIKIIDRHMGKLSSLDEQIISAYFTEFSTHPSTTYGIDVPFSSAQHMYCSRIASIFPHQMLKGKRIVLDTAHGATSYVAPLIFEELGAQVTIINNQPNGFNINEQCGTLHTQHLIDTVRHYQADIGFAFDGDGDRVAAVNRQGNLKNGDDLLAILLEHPAYHEIPSMVGTILTNEGLSHHLMQKGKQLIRTAVGDKYVTEKLTAGTLLLGGEPSGHIILNDIINTGDGILVALRVLETLINNDNWDMTTFNHFPQATINLPITQRKNLEDSPLQTIILAAQAELAAGRILVRYSGTENVLRIMVESDSHHHAQITCKQLAYELSKAL